MFRATLLLFMYLTIPALAEDGRFVDAGKMTTTRFLHSATLLKDGRVLLAGGYQDSNTRNITSKAELFDPVTGIFSPTGNMLVPRYWHSQALLPDGKVLIVGGGGGKVTDPEAEIYDSISGTFSPYTPGGIIRLGYILMDAATGTLLRGPSENPILLKDGRLVIAKYDQVEVYRIENDTLHLVDAYPFHTRWGGRASALLTNGTVLIAGGDLGYEEYSTREAFIFDPGNGTLRKTGSLSESRGYGHQMTLLPDGTVLVSGGSPDGYPSECPAEIYDPTSETFADVGQSVGETATMLLDGRVLLTGGSDADFYHPRDFVLSATGFSEHVAPGSLGSLYGPLLAAQTEAADTRSPPVSLAGVQLDVIDRAGAVRAARLLYVSPTQINFEVPAESLPGEVKYIVHTLDQNDREVSATLSTVAPSLFAFPGGRAAAYSLRYESHGQPWATLATEAIVLDERPTYLVLYATGVRGRSNLSAVVCRIDDIDLPVEYAGTSGEGIPGLDQVNVRVPVSLRGAGVANVMLTVDGVASNAVTIEVR